VQTHQTLPTGAPVSMVISSCLTSQVPLRRKGAYRTHAGRKRRERPQNHDRSEGPSDNPLAMRGRHTESPVYCRQEARGALIRQKSPLVSVVVSFASVLDRSQPFAHGGGERDGRSDAPGGRASDDLLSGRSYYLDSSGRSGHRLPQTIAGPGQPGPKTHAAHDGDRPHRR
jgi:hypothetical protein